MTLQKSQTVWHCGRKLNTTRVSVYILLCLCIWCGSLAFFEGVILGYATAGKGDDCPIPKRAASTTVMDCFVYEERFDASPRNKTFSVQCNETTKVLFNGSWAGCFAWIHTDVEVVEVIDALGICTGIIAFIGSAVAIISYLCQQHRWRLIFDILACVAAAFIPWFISTMGHLPFLTYILMGSLISVIMTTQYLLGFVPFLTWLCLAREACRSIKKWRESNACSPATPSNDENQPRPKPIITNL
ncbi:unnamed protein product [Rotaria sordida]|uniref:Uncharacterized protein n=1 Tax=Rotaria sordida TaxID=392033 RepID=A0A815I7V8_9BILA|nr:unnamed protein product [Rotaria sordida]CAF1429360.1 unnamed protein product [Rotaria sordida]CAF3908249.1 unnamed protein product [Rotaria sordida]CAF4086458.1 unnamed protein product [Rotaria sordida]